jgi:hypothetical protein
LFETKSSSFPSPVCRLENDRKDLGERERRKRGRGRKRKGRKQEEEEEGLGRKFGLSGPDPRTSVCSVQRLCTKRCGRIRQARTHRKGHGWQEEEEKRGGREVGRGGRGENVGGQERRKTEAMRDNGEAIVGLLNRRAI